MARKITSLFYIVYMNDYFETELDRVNRYFRHKIVNIITIPTIFGHMDPKNIPQFSTGFFLQACDVGIWLLSTADDRKGKRDFFFHSSVIKIEEVGEINLDNLPKFEKDILIQETKNYEQERKERIQEELKDIEQKPDVVDPTDHSEISRRINDVQKMVAERKEQEKDDQDFLEKR